MKGWQKFHKACKVWFNYAAYQPCNKDSSNNRQTLRGEKTVDFTCFFTFFWVVFTQCTMRFTWICLFSLSEFSRFFRILFVRIHIVFSLIFQWISHTFDWISYIFNWIFTWFQVVFSYFQVIFTHFQVIFTPWILLTSK